MRINFKKSPLPKALEHFPFSIIGYLLPEEVLVPTHDQKLAWRAAAQRTDIIADNLVKAFKKSGMLGRQQFNQALDYGIDTVNEPLPELIDFFNALELTPFWVDHSKIKIAQNAMGRVPPKILYSVMFSFGLPISYVSTKVNQTLARAGGLELKAASRAVETTGWLVHCTQPGGLDRFGDGFKAIARVRLVHAFIRSGLNYTGDWDYKKWDLPINQAQQALTLLPFIAGTYLTIPLGNLMSPNEIKSILHMWRYISHLIGIEAGLQLTSFRDILKMFWLTGWAEVEVDELSLLLNKALQESIPVILGMPEKGLAAKLIHQYHDNLSRLIMGRYYSEALGTPKLGLMAGIVVGRAMARLAIDLPLHFIPGANRWRIEKNTKQHKIFLDRVVQRVQANLEFNRDHAGLNELRIKRKTEVV